MPEETVRLPWRGDDTQHTCGGRRFWHGSHTDEAVEGVIGHPDGIPFDDMAEELTSADEADDGEDDDDDDSNDGGDNNENNPDMDRDDDMAVEIFVTVSRFPLTSSRYLITRPTPGSFNASAASARSYSSSLRYECFKYRQLGPPIRGPHHQRPDHIDHSCFLPPCLLLCHQ